MRKNAGFEVRSVCSRLSLFTLFLSLAACGGGDGSTVPGDDDGNPPVVRTPVALQEPSSATEINFQAATGDILLDLVSEDGFCVVNQTTEITAIVGDFRSRPLPGIAVGFYIAQGRGLIDAQGITLPDGTATVTFRSLCPENFVDIIAMTALVRGGERFTDSNSNGRYDSGEFFVDSPNEIFLDANFNEIYEPDLGEFLLVDQNNDGMYQPGGNGVYDSDIILGSSTVVIPSRDGVPAGTFPPGIRTPTPTGPSVNTPTQTMPPTSTPQAIDQKTNASQIGLSPEAVVCEDEVCTGSIPMFDLSGNCIVNRDLDITALVGDVRGRPVTNARVPFFVESGRGTINGEVITDGAGVAVATFRSLCPSDAATDITIVAAIRGKEPFVDLNSNATYDEGEPFTDLPVDSFLDGNGNGVFEPELSEYLINDENKDGQFNGSGNGVWDDDAVITVSAILKPTGGNPGNVPFLELTDISRISFANGLSPQEAPASRVLPVPMIFSDGTCVINATVEMQLPRLVILAGDFAGRPVDLGTKISIFGERGRGIIQGLSLTDSEGVTAPVYHSLCPQNAVEPITIVAAARGAEPFTDLNSNGVYDQGEPFIDLPKEVFLDGNTNGIFEPQLDEYMIWDPNQNAQFDAGGNGVWDADTVIYDVALIVPTIIETGVPAGGPIGGLVHPPSRLQAAPENVDLVMFDEAGRCIVNATTGVVSITADYLDRPTAFRRVSYFVERGRGNITVQTVTDVDGVTEATFRSVCSENAEDPITIVATTFGEEPFVDNNRNGVYDQGEPFTDLSNDAFLDANLNGIYDPANGDFLIWDPNGNNTYDAAGNGIWDSDLILSDTTVILPSAEDPQPPMALQNPTTGSSVSMRAADVTFEMFDEAGRCVISAQDNITVALVDTRGRPVRNTAVALFNEFGRGLMPEQVITDDTGTGTAAFRSLCPPNAIEEITLAAAVRGPEPFTDLNSNGVHNDNEPFVDLPVDAFLDGNRNGVYEPQLHEFLIWDEDGDGEYDGAGNGVYDTDNIITGTAILIPTRLGRPEFKVFETKTDVSRLNFGSGAEVKFESYDDSGSCVVNATADIVALAGNFQARPVDAETPVAFFTPRGRGVVVDQGLTDEFGAASVEFHNLCQCDIDAPVGPVDSAAPIKVVAAARGQEPFTDLNSNGVYDSGEPFTDLPNEVFLDADFDGIYDPQDNEYLIWDANGNQTFDPGGNNVYDNDIVISSDAVMIPFFEGTDIPVGSVFKNCGVSRATYLTATGDMATFVPFDDKGNCIGGSEVSVVATASDQINRPIPHLPIDFYVAQGRGVIEPTIVSDDDTAQAEATFRNVCPVVPGAPIVVVSAVLGREPFVDQNGNDAHDPGEPFTDLPNEAFLDANLDGIYQPAAGDILIFDRNNNGTYDPGMNGVYDDFAILTSQIVITPLLPTPTATSVPTETRPPTPTLSPTPVPTNTRTQTPQATSTRTDTPLPTNTPVPPTDTPLPPTDTPVPTETATTAPTDTPEPTPSETPEDTATPEFTMTATASVTEEPTPTTTEVPAP